MGIQFDRILEAFDGPFAEVKDWNVKPPPGTVAAGDAAGYLISSRYNDAYPAAVRLMAAGEEVHRLQAPAQGMPAGSFYVTAKAGTRARIAALATELGVNAAAATTRPSGGLVKLRTPRIALWDRYGGSMPSGWTRWILEQRKIPFDVVYASQLDAGDLRAKYDVIILVDGAIPARDGGGGGGEFGGGAPASVPAELRATVGNTSVAKTVPQLRRFLEAGGTVLTIGSSTALARHLDLPVGDKLVGRAGQAAAARAVLRPRLGAARARRHDGAGRVRA